MKLGVARSAAATVLLLLLLIIDAAQSFVSPFQHGRPQHHDRGAVFDGSGSGPFLLRRQGAYDDYLESLKRSNSSPETEHPTPWLGVAGDAGDASTSASASTVRAEDPDVGLNNNNNNMELSFQQPAPPRSPPPLEFARSALVEDDQSPIRRTIDDADAAVADAVDDSMTYDWAGASRRVEAGDDDDDVELVERYDSAAGQTGSGSGSVVPESQQQQQQQVLNRAPDSIQLDREANSSVAAANEIPQRRTTLDTTGMTERIMKGTVSTTSEAQATGAGGVSTWEAFQKAEHNWARLKAMQPFTYDPLHNPQDIPPPPQFVTQDVAVGSPACWTKLRESRGQTLDFDVVVCGGTLGILFATALRLKGYAVCVLEAGTLRGREQEWNISMDELMELVELGVLTIDDVDAAVKTAFPGCRSGFKVRMNAQIYVCLSFLFQSGALILLPCLARRYATIVFFYNYSKKKSHLWKGDG